MKVNDNVWSNDDELEQRRIEQQRNKDLGVGGCSMRLVALPVLLLMALARWAVAR